MSRIKGKNTKPEIRVRKFLFSSGLRYRLYDKNLSGKPDLVLPKYKTVIFVHGCFWHGHKGCKYYVIPKTRTKWWKEKIDINIKRDINTTNKLKSEGWKVIVIWECELKIHNIDETLHQLLNQLQL